MIKYLVRVDGHTIKKISLKFQDCDTQAKRDIIRKKLSMDYGIPSHYIRLIRE